MAGMKPKLTLRDLFWLILVVACLCGWWREHRAKVQQEVAFRERLIDYGLEMAKMSMELGKLGSLSPLND